MTPSRSTSRKKGWSGAALHSRMVYGARRRCSTSYRGTTAAASSIRVPLDEALLGFPDNSADDSLVLGLVVPLQYIPVAAAAASRVRSVGFWAGGGGIEDEALVIARPSTDTSDFVVAGNSSCGTGGECFRGGMEEEGLRFRGGGGGMEASMVVSGRGGGREGNGDE
jgi:hypothetical protein